MRFHKAIALSPGNNGLRLSVGNVQSVSQVSCLPLPDRKGAKGLSLPNYGLLGKLQN